MHVLYGLQTPPRADVSWVVYNSQSIEEYIEGTIIK